MMNLFAKDGTCKLVAECTYPLTGKRCVTRVYTEYAVFVITDDGVRADETYGISAADLRRRVPVPLIG
jgi:3-oxoadipate CoA-transferase beta subunit